MPEDNKEASLKNDRGERIYLAEVGHRQEEVRTYIRGVEIMERTVKEESTLKREIRQRMALAKEEDEVSTWYSEDQEVEDTETQEDIEPAYTEYETEKLQDTEPHDEEDFDPGDKAVDKREEISLKSVALPSERDATPPLEITCAMNKEFTGFISKKGVLAYKKTPQERILKEADSLPVYSEQKEVAESFVSVHHEEIEEETTFPKDNHVKPKISAKSKEITVPKKPRVPKEVTLMKQTDSVEVEEVPSERSMSRRETASPPLERDLPQILPQTTISCPMTAVPPKKEVITPKKMESPREEITETPKAAGKMYLENIVPLEKATPVLEELSFQEELVPVTRSILPSTEVSPPVSAQIHSPKKIVCLEEGISPPKETILPTKKISLAIPNAGVTPKEDVPFGEVTQPKKSLPPEKETISSKKPASLVQKITPEVDSSEETSTTTTKHPPTRKDDKKTKKGTHEIEQQTLQKGILSYLSRIGS